MGPDLGLAPLRTLTQLCEVVVGSPRATCVDRQYAHAIAGSQEVALDSWRLPNDLDDGARPRQDADRAPSSGMRHGLSFGVPYDEGVNARGAGLNDFSLTNKASASDGTTAFLSAQAFA